MFYCDYFVGYRNKVSRSVDYYSLHPNEEQRFVSIRDPLTIRSIIDIFTYILRPTFNIKPQGGGIGFIQSSNRGNTL